MRFIKNLLALIALAIGALWSLQGVGLTDIEPLRLAGHEAAADDHHCAGRPGRPGVGEPFAPLTLEHPQGLAAFRSTGECTPATNKHFLFCDHLRQINAANGRGFENRSLYSGLV